MSRDIELRRQPVDTIQADVDVRIMVAVGTAISILQDAEPDLAQFCKGKGKGNGKGKCKGNSNLIKATIGDPFLSKGKRRANLLAKASSTTMVTREQRPTLFPKEYACDV